MFNKKIAVLLDAGFVKKRLYNLQGKRHATDEDIYNFALTCSRNDEEIFRIYYYDCPPLQSIPKNRIGNADPKLKLNQKLIERESYLQSSLASKDLVAYRKGELCFTGWKLPQSIFQDIQASPEKNKNISVDDLRMDISQKRVDMKIGLDVAWLASKQIVDRIVLVTGDSDFIPAMKFARREGVQVVLATMGFTGIKRELREHADEVRGINFENQSNCDLIRNLTKND